MSEQPTVRGPLGPKQLAWLRKNIAKFAEANDQAKAADAHAAKVRADLEKAAQ